jgi:hypothetical protein
MTSEGEPSIPTEIDFDEIFHKNPNQAIDFEIIFAGLLATSLISISGISPILDLLSVVGGISLLFLTMIRRMAFDNPFALEEQLMDISLTAIFAVTFFSIIYFAVLPAKLIHAWLNVNYYLSVSILLFPSLLVILLLYEYFFRDFFLWAGVLFYNYHIDNRKNKLGDVLLNSSKQILNNVSFASRENMPEQVTNIHDISKSENNTRRIYSYIGVVAGVVFLIALLILIGNSTYWVVDGEVFSIISLLFLIPSLISLTGTVEFWFSRYGNAPFGDLIDLKRRMLNYLLAFFTIVVSSDAVVGF